MPTGSESAAADRARREAAGWADLARSWGAEAHGDARADLPPNEAAVLPGTDPATDLQRRGRAWGFAFTTGDAAELAWFAAGLARAEADAWDDASAGPVATRAYAERRFFLADRVLPWLVPWFDAAGRWYPRISGEARRSRDWMLGIGDETRPAPVMTGSEGLSLPGHDGYGPLEEGSLVSRVSSLWGGAIVMRRSAESIAGRGFTTRSDAIAAVMGSHRGALRALFADTAAQWLRTADDHPGTAGYWRDLAARATRTAELLAS